MCRAIAIAAVVIISVIAATWPSNKGQNVSKRPDKFTEGVWIKKYPGNLACFKFETPDGIKIVCDPYNMDEKVAADIVTESHQHGDHNDTSMITGSFRELKGPGEYDIKGIKILGIAGWHNKNDFETPNTVFVFDIDGIIIAHFASQGQVPSAEMWEKLKTFKHIDVLMMQPFYSGAIKMTIEECSDIIDKLKPKIFIAEHGREGIINDFAKRYNGQAEKISCDGFVVTKDMLNSIKDLRFLDMDNNGPEN